CTCCARTACRARSRRSPIPAPSSNATWIRCADSATPAGAPCCRSGPWPRPRCIRPHRATGRHCRGHGPLLQECGALGGVEDAPLAGREVAEAEPADTAAMQGLDMVADRREHPPHLVV